MRGRDEEIRYLTDECRIGRPVVISHHPGFGATQLLGAGLQPALRQAGFVPVFWDDWRGDSFSRRLREAIAGELRAQGPGNPCPVALTLREELEEIRSRTGRTVVVLLDRFEDYLRCHCHADAGIYFDAELCDAMAGHAGVIVLALQSHAMPGFVARFHSHVPNLAARKMTLAPLSVPAARQIIQDEAERRGMGIEPDAAAALLAASRIAQPGGAHPFFLCRALSHFLDAAARARAPVASLTLLTLLGGPDRLILESLDGEIATLDATRTELLFRWCNLLLAPDGARHWVPEKALLDYAGNLNRFAESALPALEERGILRRLEPEGGVVRYEIASDCLAPVVQAWKERRAVNLLAVRKAEFRRWALSLSLGAIGVMYAAWLWFGK